MANFTFDIALGRPIEFHTRVDGNDPTNSALILVVLAASVEEDATLRTYATLAALLVNNPEVTNTGYARKTLTDASISPVTVDTAAHTTTASIATQTFSTISAGNSWDRLVICYDNDTTGGTDANIIPVTAHMLRINNAPIVPNGNNIIVADSRGYVVSR